MTYLTLHNLLFTCSFYFESILTLQKLNLDYIDLLLIHSPRPFEKMFEYQGKDYKEENLEVWRALEEAYESGKARAIGVSNFDENDIDYLIQNSQIDFEISKEDMEYLQSLDQYVG